MVPLGKQMTGLISVGDIELNKDILAETWHETPLLYDPKLKLSTL